MLFHTLPGPRLHLLPSEICLPLAHRGLRDRIGGMRFCTEFGGFRHWTCDRRNGCCGYDVWRHGSHDQRYSSGEETSVDGCCWCDDWHRQCDRAIAWWSFYDQRELEVVFLQ
jgi:hypothetical protein